MNGHDQSFDHERGQAHTAPQPQATPQSHGAAHTQATAQPQGPGQTGAPDDRSDADRFFAQLQHVMRVTWEAGVRLVRIGNRRRLTLRSRTGEVWVRMPITLVVLLALLLVPYWPLLVVLVVVGFAVGAQASVERVAAAEPSQTPSANGGHPPAGGSL